MPSRIVREGIISSPRVNQLSMGAEVLYRRLMTVADDYGRFYASAGTLRGACWPICPGKVSESDIAEWLTECASGDDPLVVVYVVDGCEYLEIQNFGQQTRGKSKFPEIKCLANAKQMLSTCEALAQPSRIRISDSYCVSRDAEAARAPIPISRQTPAGNEPLPDDAEMRIRKLADDQPDPQEFETGVRLAIQELLSAVNPAKTLATMEANLPAWWEAMRDGRVRMKPMRWVIYERDYLRRPREPTERKAAARDPIAERHAARRAELMRD